MHRGLWVKKGNLTAVLAQRLLLDRSPSMRHESTKWQIGVKQGWEFEVHSDIMNFTLISVYYACYRNCESAFDGLEHALSISTKASTGSLFEHGKVCIQLLLIRKTQTNGVSCSEPSYVRIPVMLINSLARRPAKTSPSGRVKSGRPVQPDTEVLHGFSLRHTHTTLNLSTPRTKHAWVPPANMNSS